MKTLIGYNLLPTYFIRPLKLILLRCSREIAKTKSSRRFFKEIQGHQLLKVLATTVSRLCHVKIEKNAVVGGTRAQFICTILALGSTNLRGVST